MDIGDDSGPCPRCSGPTVVVSYDEAPWGARGNHLYSCATCGEFGAQLEQNGVAHPAVHTFLNDAYTNFDEKTVELPQHTVRRLRLQTMDDVLPPSSEALISTYQEEVPTKVNQVPVVDPNGMYRDRCHRCGRLTRDCEGGQLGDCVDYRRQ